MHSRQVEEILLKQWSLLQKSHPFPEKNYLRLNLPANLSLDLSQAHHLEIVIYRLGHFFFRSHPDTPISLTVTLNRHLWITIFTDPTNLLAAQKKETKLPLRLFALHLRSLQGILFCSIADQKLELSVRLAPAIFQ